LPSVEAVQAEAAGTGREAALLCLKIPMMDGFVVWQNLDGGSVDEYGMTIDLWQRSILGRRK
jgi:hypothetical protein